MCVCVCVCMCAEICAIHHEETVSTLIAETVTNIANYMKHTYCTVLSRNLLSPKLKKNCILIFNQF